jgi:GNAT superfamily N-acetyltransferase
VQDGGHDFDERGCHRARRGRRQALRPAGLRVVPPATLPPTWFAQLCKDVGTTEAEVRQVPLDAPEASRWIVALLGGERVGVALLGGERVGVALLETIDAEEGLVTCRHVGDRAPLKGRGYGRTLLRHALQAARDAGAVRYHDSTERANAPMRARFRSAGFADVGERLMFELRGLPERAPG